MTKPLAIDLFCGLFGWSEGLVQEGYRVIGFDLEDMHASIGISRRSEFQLVIQDVLSLHGSQFKDAALIVASPPCQRYSWMAMPWSKAKARAAEIRADESGEMLADLNALFNACFRIQTEASIAAGRHIPMVVENVRGAQPWVGRARWMFGSFALWGDVPALMPITKGRKNNGGSWFSIGGPGQKVTKQNPDGRNPDAQPFEGIKVGISFSGKHAPGFNVTAAQRYREEAGIKHQGSGAIWFDTGPASFSSKSDSRKAASAMIAKIPLVLSRHIGYSFNPPWVR